MNGEQMFIDALGREPTADEQQDIRLNLWMLTRAGFAVEDPSNAPLIAPWAWMWARLPRPADTHAALIAVSQEIAERSQKSIETVEAIAKELPANIDHRAIAAGIAHAMPPFVVQSRLDGSVFKTALRDSFSLIWIWLAAVCVGMAGFSGWHCGALREREALDSLMAQQVEQLRRQQQVIDRLTTNQPRR